MVSFFSFKKKPLAEPAAKDLLPAAALGVTTAASPFDQANARLLALLSPLLPPSPQNLPASSVMPVRLSERSVGLGNHCGTDSRGAFPLVTLKGLRLDAKLRFQLWASSPASIDLAISNLHARLAAERDNLWQQGMLRFTLEDSPPAQAIASPASWRATADYCVLFEYLYADNDGAESLITRIPINADSKSLGSSRRETTVVTGGMTRWDNEGSPALVAGIEGTGTTD